MVFISEVASPGTQHFPITGEAGDDACIHATLFICQCRVINGLAHFSPHDTTADRNPLVLLSWFPCCDGRRRGDESGRVRCDYISLLSVCLFSLKWPPQPHRQWPLFLTKHTKCSLCFSFLASYSNADWQSAKPSEVNLVKHIKEDLFKVLQASWKSY